MQCHTESYPLRKNRQTYMRLIPSEYQECKAFWDYCQKVLKLGYTLIHHANESQRPPKQANSLKSIGMTPGVCDYQYIISNKKYKGLWIEMKKQGYQNRKKRPEQDAFIDSLNSHGYYATYAYGCDDAIRIYNDYVNDRL